MGKLSMKDIMNLFKRDAEHAHRDDAVLGLGEKTKILRADRNDGAMSVEERERIGKRTSTPVMDRRKAGNVSKEDSVFGRRW